MPQDLQDAGSSAPVGLLPGGGRRRVLMGLRAVGWHGRIARVKMYQIVLRPGHDSPLPVRSYIIITAPDEVRIHPGLWGLKALPEGFLSCQVRMRGAKTLD